MSEIVDIVLPIFGLIGIGYAAIRSGLLSVAAGDGLSEFVFTVAISVLLFRTVATADLAGTSPWRIWLVYYAALAIVWILAHLLMRRLFGRDARGAVVGSIAAGFANTVLIGLPFVQQILGDEAVLTALVIISIHTPIIMVAALLLDSWAMKADGIPGAEPGGARALLSVARSLARNPVIVGILAGLAWRAFAIPLGGPFGNVVDSLARTAGPLALVASGMGIARYGLRGRFAQSSVLAALKLLLLPGLVAAGGLALGLPPVVVEASTLIAACPTGVNAFIIAGRLRTGEALASTVITLSTAFSVLTMTAWVALLRTVLG
ncbi:AEC family transporter [Propylenella binzhouense]|uniref:AEC family transporter n=1 Tax=Propylenella binzhouense TaxID=2555902 RepID=UPI001368F81A|nr:AEC family transporter [Propylenella binzhouense]